MEVLMACILLLAANTSVDLFTEAASDCHGCVGVFVRWSWSLFHGMLDSIFQLRYRVILTVECSIEIFGLAYEAYGFIEVFSGDGWISRCMRTYGVPTAAFDVKLGTLGAPKVGKQNAMDLLSDSGFAFFACNG